MEYELTIGLETHVELSTETKIFCSCSSKFGDAPNTHCCPVCIGMPGTLPKLNQTVVDYAVKAGLALNCEITPVSYMDRKNYVYPDLAKAYQISQYDVPLCSNGHIILSTGKKIRINRIHIEEDAGKLIHKEEAVLIDYNRGGVPLIEIVTEPDFSDSDEVCEYLEQLRLIMKYLGISDCKMQEGSMRCDVNISVNRCNSDKNGIKTEIKNMNSFSMIAKAISSEYQRQIKCIEKGEKISMQTLRYDEVSDVTVPMRDKEGIEDYRYFREPDLMPVYISKEKIELLKSNLPELPANKLLRYINKFELSKNEAMQIIRYPRISEYFEQLIKYTKNPKLCTNIMLTHIFRYFPDDASKDSFDIKMLPTELAEVVMMIANGEISGNFTKQIIDKMINTQKTFDELFDKNDFIELDTNGLTEIIDNILIKNPQPVADYLSGKQKAMSALIGLTMRETKGRANAKLVEKYIISKLKLCK